MHYLIDELKERVVLFIKRNLNSRNVLTVMSYFLERAIDNTVITAANKIIKENTLEVLRSEPVQSTMNKSCLVFILKDDSICVREIDLFQTVFF